MPDDQGPGRLAAVRDALARLGEPWRAGETSLSRLPDEAIRARLGVPPPRPDQLAARVGQPAAMAKAAIAAGAPRAAAPTADSPPPAQPRRFDLRDVDGHDYVTPVRNQGRAGSCVAFGVVAAMESTARYTRGAPGLDLDLSEGHLYFVHARARGYRVDTGSWPHEIFADASDKGVAFEECLPYVDDGSGALAPDWADRLARAVDVVDLTGSPARMKEHIRTRGPVTACMVVNKDFLYYTGGVYRATTEEFAGGHCVNVIGWDDDLGCWIGKNSWGVEWGEKGFFRIAYGEAYLEDYPDPRPTVHGCAAVSLRAWLPARRALHLFTSADDDNGWAYLEHFGWTRLAGGPAATGAKLTALAHARASGHRVTAFVDGTELRDVLVHD
ncbi:Papain family cysteine protease [Streptoalloteichus tenebrarius]|uniref:Papain family cysteine protease n=1 Tax=Streptoalloteichus tenebrarius (strain ATCC 17920 / DSM 40477 / JCM 4838 / CBS 697.72 / NBRC 16177 / NCIMB 11028 / NRRL B-12390 / A12253. 1 / ISP 5477) TaxID=1933 RepID=A0ABT1HVB4_STRSD|nr:C1 family peptidase [Streptoalloteichus tenebrarius]MCP2259472.1 Papain family cysteine protease [Streptoalloteichus tenebrarius]BFF01450.1 hypothetical protein GCM10020241_31250 [Streptoalloteichus tenebrarius]